MITAMILKRVPCTVRSALCALGLLTVTNGAHAAEMLITAEFRPSALEPNKNTFTNTTPRGSYCQWMSSYCDLLSAYVVDLPVNIVSKTYVKGTNHRKRLYFGLPGARRVIATNESGVAIEVDVAISSLSGQLSPGGTSNPAFTQYPQGGCTYAATAGHEVWTRFGWNVRDPNAPSPCHSVGNGGGTGFTQVYSSQYLGLGLKVTTPSPQGMSNGIYRGQMQYTIGGAGADIDLGDDVKMTDDVVVMNFEFRVEHDFKVERAPGTDTLVLQPTNGWGDWVDHGRPPSSLRQELPFLMTSSGDFSVRLECGQQVGERCAMRTDSGEAAELDVSLTIPGLYDQQSAAPVVDYPLTAGGLPRSFQVREYMQSRSSRLGFSVRGEPLQRMLELPGSYWRGDVTVIFDAAL